MISIKEKISQIKPSTRDAIVLVILTCACLSPFLKKAFHIDDPVWIWYANKIQTNPINFCDFPLNWYGYTRPACEICTNPPLNSYYIAIVSMVTGLSEFPLHLAFMLPAIGVVLGAYYLSRSLCSNPLPAAIIGMLTPVFIISSTNVMGDVMMVCFWVWAIFLWRKGINRSSAWLLLGSVILMFFSALTKYYGAGVVPLMLAYTIARERRLNKNALLLLLPIIALAGYVLVMWWIIGRNTLWDAAAFSTEHNKLSGISVVMRSMSTLIFMGGCLATALFYLAFLWSRRSTLLWILAVVIVVVILFLWIPYPALIISESGAIRRLFLIQLAFMITGGIHILALALNDLWLRKNADAAMLCLWVAGCFFFAAYLNWSVSGRTILPLAPVLGILILRKIESRIPVQISFRWKMYIPLLPAAVLVFMAAWADYRLASSAKVAAELIAAKYQDKSEVIWFQGHWGFQYYMQQRGGKPIDFKASQLLPGATMVIPENSTYQVYPQKQWAALEEVIEIPASRWITTMYTSRGAGFYSDKNGPLPFVFCSVPPERYYIYTIR